MVPCVWGEAAGGQQYLGKEKLRHDGSPRLVPKWELICSFPQRKLWHTEFYTFWDELGGIK